MTFITQPKKEGEIKDCPNCGAKLIARLKVYKDYDDKIQWQNEKETKAHYDKDGNCNGITTSGTAHIPETTTQGTITQETTLETTTTPIQTDYLEDDQKKIIKHSAESLWYIRIQVEQTIKDLEVNPNMGMIWQMTEIIYNELYGDKKQ